MGILENLENIFKVDLSGLKKFTNKINLLFQVNSNNHDNQTIVIKQLNISIDPSKLTEEQIPKVKELVRDFVETERKPVLLQDT